jgi:hypothetical protein
MYILFAVAQCDYMKFENIRFPGSQDRGGLGWDLCVTHWLEKSPATTTPLPLTPLRR